MPSSTITPSTIREASNPPFMVESYRDALEKGCVMPRLFFSGLPAEHPTQIGVCKYAVGVETISYFEKLIELRIRFTQ